MKSRLILTYVFLIIELIVKGQTVTNLHFEQSGNMIDVYYDLIGKGDESFQVKLYCSLDGGKTWGTPLKYVTGDVGENIKQGTNKIITWDVLKEKDKLVGEIKFKVEATSMSGCRSFTITHNAGSTAPVTKTVTYGVAETNLSGSNKCWITQNLGSDRQAAAATDASEASAGWYWQFNRKHGFKHDGTSRTPNVKWISSINEDSDWLLANDPCTQLLGSGWRLPTQTEWKNTNASGHWVNFTETFSSVLKLHAAGGLDNKDGSLSNRGIAGNYWSNTQRTTGLGWWLYFVSDVSGMGYNYKADGFSVRCLRD